MPERESPPALSASLLALADVSLDPIAVFDADLRHVYANDAVCRLMHIARDQVLGKRYDELPMSPTNARVMQDAVATVFATGRPLRIEVRGGRQTSRATVFDIGFHPQLGPDGKVAFVAGLSRDISTLRLAEEAARNTAKRLELLLDAVGVAVVGVDRSMSIVFANRMAEVELRELGSYQGPGQSIRSFVPPDLIDESEERITRAMNLGEAQEREVGVIIAGRWRRFRVLIEPERDRNGDVSGCVLVARDITLERQLETQLHLTERLTSLGRIAAGVAHEISNPLAVVYGNVELASREIRALSQRRSDLAPDLDEVRELLTEARDGSERIRQIVDDIGLLVRDEETSVGRVALDDVARTVIQMLGSAVRRRARLEVSLEPVPLVAGSASRLAQVVANLVQNAIQSFPVERTDADNLVALRVHRDGSDVCLQVRDNGVGIAEDEHRRVFDPFYTTRPVGEGVGLGLTVAHGIVSQHQGRLYLTSEPGAGTTAFVVLPIAPSDR
jgi:PAS domain S-box-containing protein